MSSVSVLIETKLNELCTDAALNIDNFQFFRLDRNNYGGGILIFVRNELKSNHLLKIQTRYNKKGLEVLIIQLNTNLNNLIKPIIVAAYRPPNSNVKWFGDFEELVIELKESGPLILMGDFNANLLEPTSAIASNFYSIMGLVNVEIQNIFPTRITDSSSTCLDVIALPEDTECISYFADPNGASDHIPITAILRYSPNAKITPIWKRSFKRVDWNEYYDYARGIDIEYAGQVSHQEDPNQLLSSWNHQMLSKLDELAPFRPFPRRRINYPWITDNIKTLISDRKKLARQIKNIHTNNQPQRSMDLEKLSVIKKRIKSLVRFEHLRYSEKILQEGKSKDIWKLIRTSTMSTSKGTVSGIPPEELNDAFAAIVHDPNAQEYLMADSCDRENCFNLASVTVREVARALKTVKTVSSAGADGLPGIVIRNLADAIASNITFVFNSSIATNIFPDVWKLANIVPVYKCKGSKTDPSNYRPISILPLVARTFEKLICTQLASYCTYTNVIPPNQHGFRKSGSCETALIAATDHWLQCVDQGEIVATLLIDLSKAFDTIPHQRLLCKLRDIGFNTNALHWFKSYLANRKQRVISMEGYTKFVEVNRGVPQGSGLSPLLFNIYVSELPECCTSHVFQFADDITQSEHSTSLVDAKSKLVDSFRNIEMHCNNLGLTININKTQFIIFKAPNKKLDTNPEIIIQGVTFQALQSVTLLGFALDQHLLFGTQIKNVTKKCRGLLGVLRKVSTILPKEILKLMYTSLIRTHLEYGSAILQSASTTHRLKLETIQKIAARIICSVPNDTHAAPLLEALGLEVLEDRRKTHCAKLLNSIEENTCHPALVNLLSFDSNHDPIVPTYRTTAGRRRFSVTISQIPK